MGLLEERGFLPVIVRRAAIDSAEEDKQTKTLQIKPSSVNM
jgi:hypothetical protein